MGHGPAASLQGHLANIFGTFSILVFSAFVVKLPDEGIRKAVRAVVFSLLISAVGTTLVSTVDPMALRYYGGGGGEASVVSAYRMMGMMSYSQAHAVAVVIPPLMLLMVYVNKTANKILCAVLAFLLLRILFVMEVTTALIAAIIASFVIMIFFKFKINLKRILCLCVILIAIALYSGILTLVWEILGSVEDVDVAVKLASFSTFEGGEAEGDLGTRITLYTNSFMTFLSNPIFGWGTDNGSWTRIGEHSFLLDYLAYYGLFALLLFVGWYNEYKSLNGRLYGNNRTSYYYCLIPLVILIPLKSPFAYRDYLFISLVAVRIIFLYISKLYSPEMTKTK